MKKTNIDDFDFVAKMFAGEELTEEEKLQKEILDYEYDEAQKEKQATE